MVVDISDSLAFTICMIRSSRRLSIEANELSCDLELELLLDLSSVEGEMGRARFSWGFVVIVSGERGRRCCAAGIGFVFVVMRLST